MNPQGRSLPPSRNIQWFGGISENVDNLRVQWRRCWVPELQRCRREPRSTQLLVPPTKLPSQRVPGLPRYLLQPPGALHVERAGNEAGNPRETKDVSFQPPSLGISFCCLLLRQLRSQLHKWGCLHLYLLCSLLNL